MVAHDHDHPLQFRFAALSDVEDIVELVESAYRGDASRIGWTTEADLLDGQRTDLQQVREIIEQPNSVLLLGLSNRLTLGCCKLVRAGDEIASFGMFAVRPEFQGNGLGAVVLSTAERVVREKWGARFIQMTVISQRQELIAWYRRKGYEPSGKTEPFPYGNKRFGIPLREDLEFVVLEKSID